MTQAPAESYAAGWSLADLYSAARMKCPPEWANDIQIVLPDNSIPSEFQVRNLNRILRNSYWGFLDEAGTGKTLPAQAYILYMASHGYRSVAVMPPVLREQFVRKMHETFVNSDQVVSMHVLDEEPYPARVNKRRVQDMKAALYRNQPVPEGTLDADLSLIRRLKKAQPLMFTREQLQAIRESGGTQAELAAQYSCSKSAIGSIKRLTFREDLFAEWKEKNSWPDVLIMSYQMFIKVATDIEEAYSCLLADEAHALCHPTSTQHRKVKWFLEKRDRTFLPMTGTPAPNLPTDTYGLIKLLNPKAYENFSSFKALHVDTYEANTKDGARFEVVNGYINLDIMSQSLYAKASRVLKEDVIDIGVPRIIEEEVELSKQHLELYRKLVRTRLLVTEQEYFSASEVQQLRQRALQIIMNPDLYEDTPIKEHAIKEWLTQKLDTLGCAHQEKVVVFAQFNATVRKLAGWFEDLNPALVYGKSDTQKNVQKFLTDDSCRLMIAHPKSGGVGVDGLQDLCRYVIFIEPTAIPGDFGQALDRLARRGQKRAVVCYILRVLRTPWPKRVDEMRRKMKLISDVTLDQTALLAELLDG